MLVEDILYIWQSSLYKYMKDIIQLGTIVFNWKIRSLYVCTYDMTLEIMNDPNMNFSSWYVFWLLYVDVRYRDITKYLLGTIMIVLIRKIQASSWIVNEFMFTGWLDLNVCHGIFDSDTCKIVIMIRNKVILFSQKKS